MSAATICAVDPGSNGGIALLSNTGDLEVVALPKPEEERINLLENLRLAGVKKLFLEDLVLFNGQRRPGSSMAIYAASWGFVLGATTALNFTVTKVAPQQWMKIIGADSAGIAKGKWKPYLADLARAKFPGVTITLQTADAALIAAAANQGFGDRLRCSVCRRYRPPTAFYKGVETGGQCKDCQKLRNPTKRRKAWLKNLYGLTEEDFSKMQVEQDAKCAICKETGRLFIDHCHTTNKVRGLLCPCCNFALGGFKDSPEILTAAIGYLNT